MIYIGTDIVDINRIRKNINSQKKSEGYSVSAGYEEYIGKKGITKTDLRPAGIVIISEKEFHCRSKGDFIELGKEVLVEKVEENELIVSGI